MQSPRRGTRGYRYRPGVISVVLALVAAHLVFVLVPTAPATADTRPNIVVVVLDDARLDQMAAMPNTQALIRDLGVEFTNASNQGTECCPSRASFFTGQYIHNHEVFTSGNPYAWQALDEENTLATWLDAAGYYTSFTGKYLNGYGVQAAPEVPVGWDDWYGGVDPWTYYYKNGKVQLTDGSLVDVPPGSYLTDLQGEHVVDVVEAQEADDDTPFYVHFAPIAPHVGHTSDSSVAWPYPADRHAGSFTDPIPSPPSMNEPDISDKPSEVAKRSQYSETNLNAYAEQWRDGIETMMAVDESVGDLVAALTAAGEMDNTVFVVTSDNGYMFGEHRIWGKYLPYEESIDTPLYIRGPGITPGLVRSQMVGTIDITATLVDVADATPSHPLDGVSLLPMIANSSLGTDRVMGTDAGPPGRINTWHQARGTRYVYTEWDNGDREFYDLQVDPYQLENAISEPAYAGLIATYEGHLDQLRSCVGYQCRIGLAGYPSPVSSPAVTSVDPAVDVVAGGREVTVSGNGLAGATAVSFGATPATSFTVVSDTEVTATVPAHAVGEVRVTVTTPGGTSSAGLFDDAFEYIATPPAPTLTTVVPNELNALGGVEVTLTGSNLGYVDQVTFGGTPASSVTVVSPSEVTAVSPPHAAGGVSVVASSPWASSGSVGATYVDPGPAPTVTSLSPNKGTVGGGTIVTINGTGFNHVTGISFGNAEATTWTVVSPTKITVTAPPYVNPQLVNVLVTTWAGTSPVVAWKTWFNYGNYPVPDVDVLSPNRGPTTGGTTVVITGTNFTAATGVTFAGVPATSFTVNSDTQITATAPPFATPYLVSVKVTGPGGTSAHEGWNTAFGYQPPGSPPNVDSRTPSQGPISGGTVVTITGTNFTGATGVTFGNVAAPSVTVNSSTSITATTPPFPVPYLVSIRVIGPGGTSAHEGLNTSFGYKAA